MCARPKAWAQIFDEGEEHFGPTEAVCNVAGYLRPGFAHELEAGEVDLHVDVNVKVALHGTTAAARSMKPRGRGHIANVASLAGVVAVPGFSLYSASKFAVRGFSLSVAQELRPHGVVVTVIGPDAVHRPMLEKQVAAP
jgi:short-subunit dehydrogenase